MNKGPWGPTYLFSVLLVRMKIPRIFHKTLQVNSVMSGYPHSKAVANFLMRSSRMG